MSRAKSSLLIASAALVSLSACTDPGRVGNDGSHKNAQQGAILGGILGATVGIISGDNAKERRENAVKGAIIAGAAGGILGNQLDKQEADLRRDLDNGDVKITNTGDRLIVTLPDDILFASDSTLVRADLQRDLQKLAGNLQAYPDTTVQVVGHTDNVGDAGYNQNLSNRRADAVASVLMDAGVTPSRVRSIGRGEDQPIASNLSPEGRSQNRRVEIVILPNAA